MVKLGWPVEGVGDFLDGLVQDIVDAVGPTIDDLLAPIKSALAGLADAVWNALPEWIKSGLTFLGELAGKAWESLWAFISDPVGSLAGLADAVWDLVGPTLAGIGDALAGVGEAVYDALPQPLKDFVDWIGELGRALWDGLSSFVEDPVGALKTGFDGVVSTVTTAFDGAMATVGGWVSDALAGVAKALGDALGGFVSWVTEKLSWIAESIIGVANIVKDVIVVPIAEFGRDIATAFLEAVMPGSPDKETKETVEKFVNQYLKRMEELVPEKKSPLPSLPELLTSAAGVVTINVLASLGGQGVAIAIDQAHPIKNMGLRAMVGDLINSFQMPAMIGPMLGSPVWPGIIIPLRYRMNEMFPNMVPDPMDLIRFTVREVILPDEFYATMLFHGYSRKWSRAFWEAHWVLPAFGNLVDAYHRGVITSGELDKFIVWHDYSPTARPGIGKSDVEIMRGVVKTLITRVDLRRGWELGAIGDAELVERFRARGYEDDSELAAEIQKRVAMEAEIGKLRDNAKSDFVKGYILEADLRSTLQTLGFGVDTVEYHVQDALQDRERKRKDALVDNYLDAYIKELIATEDELAGYLKTVIVDPDLVTLIVDDAYIRRYKKPKGD